MENENIKHADDMPVKEFVDYEFGDLYLKCSCGKEEKLNYSGVEGIRIDLAATNSHEIRLVCSECGHEMVLFFKEAENIEALRKIKAEQGENFVEIEETEVSEEEIGGGLENEAV